jgi:hypothetical protein
MDDRTPRDGQPYYCVKCECGFAEYMACELPDCELESEASAEMRQLFTGADPDGSKENDD